MNPIKSAYELENVLKERYGVGGPNKKARSLAAYANMAVARMAADAIQAATGPRVHVPHRRQTPGPFGDILDQDLMLNLPAFGLPGFDPPPEANGSQSQPLLAEPNQPAKELAGLNYIGAGLKDGVNGREAVQLGDPGATDLAESPSAQGGVLEMTPSTQQPETTEKQDKQTNEPAVEPKTEAVSHHVPDAALSNIDQLVPPPPVPPEEEKNETETTTLVAGEDTIGTLPSSDEDPAEVAAAAAVAAAAMPIAEGLQLPTAAMNPDSMSALLPGSVDLQAILNGAFPPLNPASLLPGVDEQLSAGLQGISGLPFSLMSSNWPAFLSNPALWTLGGLTLPQPGHADASQLLPAFALQPSAGLDPAAAAALAAAPVSTGVKSGGRDDSQKIITSGDRPGRPPSYDDMVRWCVDLKRILWQRHVPLTIEEAVAMVNDPALCSSASELPKTKTLVASTLRKRVLGIYKITWSQVATDADPGQHDEVINPSVLTAASAKLRRHGMDGSARPGGLGGGPALPTNKIRIPLAMAAPPAPGSLADASAPATTGINVASEHINPPPKMPEAGHVSAGMALTPHVTTASATVAATEKTAAEIQHSLVPIQPADCPSAAEDRLPSADRKVSSPLDSAIPSLPLRVKEVLAKGRTHFLGSDEVHDLLVNAQEYGLPLSTHPQDRPSAGSMFLFDRSCTARFRCDGYEWRRRETHAKRKVGDEYKLNCYYVGGAEDEVQRRCYWLLDDKSSDLVFVHYLPAPPGRAPWGIAQSGEVSEGEEIVNDVSGGMAGMGDGSWLPPDLGGLTGEMSLLSQQGGNILVEVQELNMPLPLGLGMVNDGVASSVPYQALLMQHAAGFSGHGATAAAQQQQQQNEQTESAHPPQSGEPLEIPLNLSGTASQHRVAEALDIGDGSNGSDLNQPVVKCERGDAKAQLRERIAVADLTDPDSMFNAMCNLNLIAGITKQERAAVCQLWMDNVLDDKQKKQLFMYIKSNVEDDEAVADWVRSIIKKNGV